ncbi:SMC-Scp complex subunit ScpB [Telmatobacter bradus]|uniref:SMC-Scp complex subunit ScpB n=1 Tax=Telmatobacter bradus TaxID=474953 RepID=UPI003B436887
MSLKAKLEAVIYAAEEPVTLAQLAVLFAEDALEFKAEQEANAAALAESQQADDAPLLEGVELTPAEGNAEDSNAAAESNAPAEGNAEEGNAAAESNAPAEGNAEEGNAAAESAVHAEVVAGESVTAEAEGESPATATEADQEEGTEEPAESEEAIAKRLAKQRDREAKAVLRQLLDELVAESASDSRGVEIREIAGGYRMATKPECHDAVRGFVKSLKPVLKLSLPALETLAVIAYKQPVTAPEVNEIRGVESSGVFGSLLTRKLIATAGRKQVIGRPILYKTTKEFLLRFGLKDLNELPSMEEFEKMAALELEEPETAQETASETAVMAASGEHSAESQPAAEPVETAPAPQAADEAVTDQATPEDASAERPAIE